MTHKFLITSAVAALLLSACATTTQNIGSDFGQASAHNRAVHEVLPTKAQKNNTYIPADAKRQSDARKAYRENEVKEPKPISTR